MNVKNHDVDWAVEHSLSGSLLKLKIDVDSLLEMVGGTPSVDNTTLDRPLSQKKELARHFWSGKHHCTVKGPSLVTLYYIDVQGRSLPVNYRVYDKADGKTKNDYFQDMLAEGLPADCNRLLPPVIFGVRAQKTSRW